MPDFTYTGVNRQGLKVSGKVTASSETELRHMLRGQGIRPIRFTEGSQIDINQDIFAMLRPKPGTGSVSTSLLSTFTRQLHVLVGSGIPLVTGLEILGDQTDDINLKHIVTDIKEKVQGGGFLWESMSNYPKAFPRIYCAMIRAAESSGALEPILDRLAFFLESADKLTKQIKSAMFYPIMVSFVGMGVVTGMLLFVIPKFEDMLKQSGQALPWITQALIDASHFTANNFHFIAIAGFSFGYLVVRYVRSEEGRIVFERALLSTPIFGKIVQKASIARFTRTLSTLLSSGVSMIEAIEICKNTVGNAVIEDAVKQIKREIEEGHSMSSVMAQLKVFPKLAVQMVKVGESTGSLDKMLDRMAKIYETDVEIMVGGLGKLIEPIILVVLGGMVAVVLIAMYLPVFSMAGSAGG